MSLTACATPSAYAGIPLGPGAADPLLQELARGARRGDKQAQLALGKRYEDGDGVAYDLRRARNLYKRAAADTGGMQLLSIPGRHGIVSVPVSKGPLVRGLPEAQARLERLESGSGDPGRTKPEAGAPPRRLRPARVAE